MFSFIPKRLRGYPQVSAHNWLIHDLMFRFLKSAASEHVSGKLADIGCGTKPYEPMFAPFVDEHIGVDMESCPHGTDAVNVIGTAYETTLESGHYDSVLSSEVLEHLEDPLLAIQEMNRILKDGGSLILTVPFFWHIHEAPRDFYRYTEFGLRHLLEKGGFEIVEIRPLTGYIATFTQLSIYYLMRFQRGFILRGMGKILHYIMQSVALFLNRYDRSTGFTNLYGVIARKPSR